jgi:hypothetical protein
MVYAKFFLTKKVKRQNKAIATKISATNKAIQMPMVSIFKTKAKK